MPHKVVEFPQFAGHTVLVSAFTDLQPGVLSRVKNGLLLADPAYDYCFLSTTHLVSLEHLYSAIYRAILNENHNCMRARTLNTEVIFNLSPVNNIMDALKRFGVDENSSSVVVIKVFSKKPSEKTLQETNGAVCALLEAQESQNPALSDELLYETFDVAKFKKVYKLNDVRLPGNGSEVQAALTRLAVAACLLRGQ